MSKQQQYLPIPQPGHNSPSKNNLSTLPSLHAISALGPLLQQLASPPKRFYGHLAAPFPSHVSHPNGYTFQPQGKEFALGGAHSTKGNGRNTLWLARPPGIRSKYGKTNMAWNIV
jgi:hypothetical protein